MTTNAIVTTQANSAAEARAMIRAGETLGLECETEARGTWEDRQGNMIFLAYDGARILALRPVWSTLIVDGSPLQARPAAESGDEAAHIKLTFRHKNAGKD